MFHFKLVTPDRTLADLVDVVSVSLPTADGEITVLKHHAPITALLVPGLIRMKRMEHEEEIAVSGGFIHIDKQGGVTVLAETAERGEELELTVIDDAKERAKKVMRDAVTHDDVAYAAAAAGLERELAREKLAIKHRHRRGV